MTTLNDAVSGLNQQQQEIPTYEPEVMPQRSQFQEMLKAQTGDGEIAEYMNHTLNFNQSAGVARIIRGLTGMFGALNYAVIDIGIGLLDLLKSNAKKVNTNAAAGNAVDSVHRYPGQMGH